jgi:hypothetical protein
MRWNATRRLGRTFVLSIPENRNFSRLGRVIIERAINLQFSSYQPNAGRIDGDDRGFLERLIIVEPVFHICNRSQKD